MDRRVLRSPNDIQSDGLMGVAAEALNFEIKIPCVDGVA
jgi:hypothetical protein